MASLETLSIQIDANAMGANEGINKIIGSLRRFAKAIGTVTPAIRSLNSALKELQKYGGIKVPNVSGTRTATSTGTSSSSATNPANAVPQPQDSGTQTVPETTQTATETKNEAQQAQQELKKTGEAADEAKKKMSGFAQTFSQIGRIFKTMMIRSAIRSLIKSFGEAWQAAYEFSKKTGGDFAKNVDSIKGSLKGASVAIINAFAPLLSVVAPVINAIAQGIKFLSDMILQLLSLIGLTAEALGGAAASASNAGSSASKAAKNSIASFDELNIIDRDTGGSGGGGSGSSSPGFSDAISEELAKIQALVGEFMIAIGLVLAFTGHVPIGVGMIAVGAAMLVKTVTADWGKLTDETKAQITKIMVIAGASMLAIGAILAFSGINIPLGIAMMAAGGLSLVAAVAVNWGAISEKLKNTFAPVVDWLKEKWDIVKGAVNDAWTAVSTWWTESAEPKITAAWEGVKKFFSDTWGFVTRCANGAWEKAKQWWETNVSENIKQEGVWGGVKGFFIGVFNTIKNYSKLAFDKVLEWIGINPEAFSAVWESVKEGISSRFEQIGKSVSDAWANVKEWIKVGWADFGKGWTDIKAKLVDRWEQIKKGIGNAWELVKTWIDTKWSNFSSGWDNIKANLVQRWNDIKKSITDAKDKVKEWWEQGSNGLVTKIRGAWNGLSGWFEKTVTKPINTAWENIKKTIKGVINTFIDALNKLGSFDIPEIKILGKVIVPKTHVTLWNIPRVATGAYGMDAGQLFIANERGAEMVGSMDGKTAVANQQQIVEGIRKGVADGQAEQNALLRQQNQILLSILQKTGNGLPGASSALGRVVSQSLDMYGMMVGR